MRRLKLMAALALIIIMAVACASPSLGEPANITKKCEVTVSEGKASSLLSGGHSEKWTGKKAGASVTVTAKEAGGLGGIFVRWYEEPVGYTLTVYDSAGNLLSEKTEADYYIGIENFFPLDAGAHRAVLTMTAEGQRISSLRVSSEGAPFDGLPDWRPTPDKADLMVISTHQDDEELYFGGTIPYYSAVRGKDTVVMYMADCGRERREEALNGLWAMNHRSYPVFLNMRDKRVDTVNEGLKLWGGEEKIIGRLVEQIRIYRPEVIVTHDLEGEYGHNQHKITARLTQKAVEQAADPAKFPESAEKYGAWQVKKLYLHLYGENSIKMDWQTAFAELDGKTPSQMAALGYKQHASQHKYFKYEDGGKYDNARFGLIHTSVGPDVEKNDFFENIPEQ